MEVLDLQDTNIYHDHSKIKPDARSALEPMYIQHNPHTFPKDPSSSKIHKESKIYKKYPQEINQIKLPQMKGKNETHILSI